MYCLITLALANVGWASGAKRSLPTIHGLMIGGQTSLAHPTLYVNVVRQYTYSLQPTAYCLTLPPHKFMGFIAGLICAVIEP